MLARLIAAGHDFPALELAQVPRVGDTLDMDAGEPWRVLRVHWAIIGNEGAHVDLHVTLADYGR